MPPKKAAAAAAGVGAAAKKKTAKGAYQMPEHLPAGTVLTDLSKQQWKIGPSIGTGGFGVIYSACQASAVPKKVDDYQYVVKIEPHTNGPLFVEMHFYMRNAKQEDIETFRKAKRMSSLGIPHFVGSGSHELNAIKHRFVVMPRFGKDISKCWLENGKRMPQHTAYRLALQMLDAFEYIHGCTYVHADLKGANMLLGVGKAGAAQAYLVDFGLASHYTTAAEFKPDPKKMHNGTIEYTSRDAHCGVPTRRGDLEILAYNLVHWSGAALPWETGKLLENAVKVHEAKKTFMENVEAALKGIFSGGGCPAPITQFFKYVTSLQFNTAPDYAKCRKIFEAGLKSLGKVHSGVLDFKSSAANQATTSPKKNTKKTSPLHALVVTTTEEEDDSPPPARKPRAKKPTAANRIEPLSTNTSVDETPPSKRTHGRKRPDYTASKDDDDDNESGDWSPAEVMPAKKARKARGTAEAAPSSIVEKENATSSTTNGTTASKKTAGSMTVNNDILTSKGSRKKDKTYEFNFELDVSVDANVVINVKRKPRKEASPKKTTSSRSTPLSKVTSTTSSRNRSGGGGGTAKSPTANGSAVLVSDDDEIEASPDVTPVASMRVLKKDTSRLLKAATGTPITSQRRN